MRAILLCITLTLSSVSLAYAQAEQAEPAQTFSRFLRLFLPDYAEQFERLGTPDQYEAPEVLPNGDILIRRKPQPLPPPKEGEIDL